MATSSLLRAITAFLVTVLPALHSAPAKAAKPVRRIDATGARSARMTFGAVDLWITSHDLPELSIESDSPLSVGRDDETIAVEGGSDDAGAVKIRCPEDLRLNVTVERGEVIVTRLYGTLGLRLVDGSLTIDRAVGSFDVQVDRGNVSARVFLADASKFQVNRGDIEIAVLDAAAFPLVLKSGEGDLSLRIPPGFAAELDARADGGAVNIEVPIGLRIQTPEESGGNRRVAGTLGTGGPLVELQTDHGGIDVLAANDEESSEATVPQYVAPRIEGGISVDGELEAPWLDAPNLRFESATAGPSTHVQFAWDDEHLFIAAAAEQRDWASLALKVLPDDPDFEGAGNELGWGITLLERHLGLIVNPLGTRLDDEPDDDGLEIAIRLLPGWWVLEMSVRVDGLEPDTTGAVRLSRGGTEDGSGDQNILLVLGERRDPREERIPIRVEAEGDATADEITEAVGLPADGLIRLSDLPAVEARARRLGWFREVGVSLTSDGETETALLSASGFQATRTHSPEIDGATVWQSDDLRFAFDWRDGWIANDAIESRRRLMENAYRAQGYALATVRSDVSSDGLRLIVDEGRIDAIRVVGARAVPRADIESELASSRGQPYNRWVAVDDCRAATDRLSRGHRELMGLSDGGAERADGGVVWTVIAEERSRVGVSVAPIVAFTQVHVWELGATLRLRDEPIGRWLTAIRMSGLQYAERTDGRTYRVNGSVGARYAIDTKGMLVIGGVAERASRAQLWQGSPGVLSSLTALAYGSVPGDYHTTDGVRAFTWFAPHRRVKLEAGISADIDRSLRSLLDRSILTRGGIRPNRPASDGTTHYASLDFMLDLRDVDTQDDMAIQPKPEPSPRTRLGLLAQVHSEVARFIPALPDDGSLRRAASMRFVRVQGNLAAYAPLGDSLQLTARCQGQWTRQRLPIQRQWWLGGAATLRGFETSQFVGDLGGVIGADLAWHLPWAAAFLAAFGDAGATMWADEPEWDRHWYGDAGISMGIDVTSDASPPAARLTRRLGFQRLQMDIALPVRGTDERTPRFWLWATVPY
ncbi:hypothetical protein FJZ36_01080 [Candidatus Poribacteria bacterium]|nr:hypothetical protein [Candidatus Poribacteria bacterium]